MNERLVFLDGLRGVAALLVITIHAGGLGLRSLGAMGHHIADITRFGVTIFFVLSGFLLCLTAAKAIQTGTHSWVGFYIRRFGRILPSYFAVLAIVAVFVPQTPASLLAHFSMLNVVMVQYANDILGVEWSTVVEVSFYVTFPLGFWLLGRFPWMFAALVAVSSTAFFRVASDHLTSENTHYTLLGHGYAFGLGMLTYWLATHWRHQLLGVMAAVVTVAVAVLMVTAPESIYTGPQAALLAASLILAGLGLRPVALGLSAPPLRFLGAISFPLYLVHLPIFGYLGSLGLTQGAIALLGIAAAIVSAAILHYGLEIPSQRLARHWAAAVSPKQRRPFNA